MNPGLIVAAGLGWILCHFLAYVVGLRQLTALQSERGIFLFHALSFLLVLGSATALVLHQPAITTLAAVILVLSSQGIYSLSFLELWSLSQGSYSLSLLAFAAEGKIPTDDPRASEIGSAKVRQRLESLQRLALISRGPERERLTARGSIVAFGLRALFRMTGGRSLNQ